jgi:hypothetical protein
MPENSSEKPPVTAEILSISVNSRITPSLEGKPVKLPNWKPGVDLSDGLGSKRPGVFKMGNWEHNCLAVKVNVTGLCEGETATLTGQLEEMVFTGTATRNGTHTVMVVPRSIPKSFKWICDDMEWSLQLNDGRPASITPEKTRLELFWIYDYPGLMYKRGVWIEVLRILAMLCSGAQSSPDLVRRIVNHCHLGTALKYDSTLAASYYAYGTTGGPYALDAYLKVVWPVCNCLDQAGALQSFFAALGLNNVNWILMSPYGFLSQVHLIGRSQCNNPIFLSPNATGAPIVDINAQKRTGFYNHAFCEIGDYGLVLDSCAGPHLGNETRQQYACLAVDTSTSLYREGYIPYPGTAFAMKRCQGVTDVSGLFSDQEPAADDGTVTLAQEADIDDERIETFKRDIGIDKDEAGIRGDWGIVMDWPKPTKCPDLKDWKITYGSVRTGDDTTLQTWILAPKNAKQDDDQMIHIDIYVSNEGTEKPKKHLLRRAAAHSTPDIPLKKSAEKMGDLHLVSSTGLNDQGWWTYYNVYFTALSHNSDMDMVSIARWFHDQAKANVKDNLSDYLPKIEKITVSHDQITVDGETTITVEPEPGPGQKRASLMMDFYPAGDQLRLVRENKFRLSFKGNSPGETGIGLVLANTKNLLCSPVEFTPINVLPILKTRRKFYK